MDIFLVRVAAWCRACEEAPMSKSSNLAINISITALVASLGIGTGVIPVPRLIDWGDRSRLLSIKDDDGQTRILLSTLGTDSSSNQLMDADGNIRAELAVSATGLPGLAMLNEDGTTQLSVSMQGRGGQPRIFLASADGTAKWRVWIDEQGDLQVELGGADASE